MNGGGLRTVLESIHRGELAVTSERIVYVVMRIGDANDRFVIPTKNTIQEAHRAGVGDEGADIGLINERNHESNMAGFLMSSKLTRRREDKLSLVQDAQKCVLSATANPRRDKS
jgi:hypothetical protein